MPQKHIYPSFLPGICIPIEGIMGGTAGAFPSGGAPGIIGGIAIGGAWDGIGI